MGDEGPAAAGSVISDAVPVHEEDMALPLYASRVKYLYVGRVPSHRIIEVASV
jgi:hypothetical protein